MMGSELSAPRDDHETTPAQDPPRSEQYDGTQSHHELAKSTNNNMMAGQDDQGGEVRMRWTAA